VTKNFRDLGVAAPLCDALERQQITNPFPIQELTLPLALAGNDVIGQARTGMGKTLAFGLPLLQRIDGSRKVTQALVVVPTRELCLQVHNDLTIGTELGLSSISVYGGVGYDEQLDALADGAHVVVGTPGRLLDHLQRGTLDLSNVTELVLDEADEMLDMGFLPDVERLIEACTAEERHTMLFSATMPTAIVKLARRYMRQPTFTRAESADVDTAPRVEQHFLQVHRMDKPRVLARILQAPERQAVYVFVRTKHMADRLVNDLEELATPAIAIHGDLRQATREKNLDRFRSGKASVLIATEVAARGLDVDNVTHVVNYDCPDDDKMYLHRIGRTARAGRAGVAVTFAEHHETERLNVIRKAVGAEREVVPVFSTSDELTTWFDLPDTTPWGHLAGRRAGGNGNGRRTGAKAVDDRGGTRDRRAAKAESRGGDAPRADAEPRGDTRPRGDGGPRAGSRARRAPEARERGDRPTRGSAEHDAPAIENPTRDGAPAERVRTRARTRATTASEERGSAPDAPRRAKDGSGDEPERRAGGSRQQSETASDRTAASRNRQGRGGGTSRARSGGASRGGRTSRSDNTSRSDSPSRGGGASRERAGRDRRAASSDASSTTPSAEVPLAGRGEEARGAGQPQRARRVKVEHLP
jgi:superfamily II DNA/RNA helicase